MKQNNLIVLGVTGGIGCGKSTVSRILQEQGAEIIDADIICREIVMPGENALKELIETFGSSIVDDCGKLRRKYMAEMVFHNEEKLQKLNSIMHRHVAISIQDKIEELKIKGAKVVVVDVPIPIKTGFLDLCDQIWTVTSTMDLRIDRLFKRSGMTRDEAISRINSQMSEQEYLNIADTVIHNDKDLKHLKEEVKQQYDIVLNKYKFG